MYKTATGDLPARFLRLKKRGDRAMAEAREAIRMLKISLAEFAELRDKNSRLPYFGRPEGASSRSASDSVFNNSRVLELRKKAETVQDQAGFAAKVTQTFGTGGQPQKPIATPNAGDPECRGFGVGEAVG